jgi:sensor domain CHASE-containing protein
MLDYLPYITSTSFTVIALGIGYLKFIRGKEATQEQDRLDVKQRVKLLEEKLDPTINGRVAQLEGKMVGWEEHSRTLASIAGMQKDLATLTEQSKVFWEVISPKLRDIIHSPIHKTRDALVDLLVEDKINTVEQAETLQSELEKLWAETCNPAEQVASAIFLARTKWLLQNLQKHIDGEQKE